MTDRDKQRLSGVAPKLVEAVSAILGTMEARGTPMFVVVGVRTAQEQAKLYAEGRTTPGPDVSPQCPLGRTVTNADGISKKSNHQIHSDGLGHAVDCGFVGSSPFDESHPWDVYGAHAEAHGLVWGGHWHTRVDKPHVELP